MKITHFENEYGFSIDLIPETPEEVAQLARIAMNRVAEPAEINLFVSGKEPSASIWIKKVKPGSQTNVVKRAK